MYTKNSNKLKWLIIGYARYPNRRHISNYDGRAYVAHIWQHMTTLLEYYSANYYFTIIIIYLLIVLLDYNISMF